jgi:4-hydroxybenzoate polyprenyltransferase
MELLRAPNLFTVPGDPIAGFLLAGTREPVGVSLLCMLYCAAASLFLYMAGLITNDLWDLEEDRRERPSRPIASGRIRPQTAIMVAAAFFVLGIASAALAGFTPALVAWTLMFLILAYNGGTKREAIIGPLNMGLCRGASLLIGAAAFGPDALWTPVVLVAAGGLTLYVASVTLIASKETVRPTAGRVAWLVPLTMAAWMTGGILSVADFCGRIGHPLAIAVAVVAVIRTLRWAIAAQEDIGTDGTWDDHDQWSSVARRMISIGRWATAVQRKTPSPKLPHAVAGWIRALLPAQACLAALAPGNGILFGIGLFLAWPVSTLVGRRFYAS